MSKKLLIFAAVPLVAAIGVFSWVAISRSVATASSCCPHEAAATQAPAQPHAERPSPAAPPPAQRNEKIAATNACAEKCLSGMTGAAKHIYEEYTRDTAELRKELSDARQVLRKSLSQKSPDRNLLSRQIAQVNERQGRLFSAGVAAHITMRAAVPEDQVMDCCKNDPVACIMTMSEQCPMMLSGGGPRCDHGVGCAVSK